jgi:hypothetical protein
LQFSVSFENKGKKNVEQPRILIYAIDFAHRIWGIWNKSDADQIVTKGCSLEYHFPSEDQKTIGAWAFWVLLYDDSNGQLLSYATTQFATTDVAPVPWYQNPSYVFVTILYSVLGVVIVYMRFFRNKKRRKAKLEPKGK